MQVGVLLRTRRCYPAAFPKYGAHPQPSVSAAASRGIMSGCTIEAVLDERLVGYWQDEDLYQGSMEAADIAFRGDGTGWT